MHVYTNSHKLKVDQKFFWVALVKNSCGQSGHGTSKWLYLKNDFFLHIYIHKYYRSAPKIGEKLGFLIFLKKLVVNFHWICSIMKIFYYLLCSNTNPIFGKNFDPEILVKILSANQIARFLNYYIYINY